MLYTGGNRGTEKEATQFRAPLAACLQVPTAGLWPNHARPCGSFALLPCRLVHISSCLVAFARLGSPPGKAQGASGAPACTPITGSQAQPWEGVQRA